MPAFIDVKHEETLQVNDKTRIDISSTFSSSDITLDEFKIEPEAGAGFIDVTSNKYLDWAYSSDGDKVVTVEVLESAVSKGTLTATISVVTEADDKLFSNDSDLTEIEDDILNYIRKGRSSYKDKHRQAQKRIIDSLDRRRLFDQNGNRLTKEDLYSIDEVKQWSTYLTLQVIYEGLRTDPDDLYTQKADTYRSLAKSAEHSAVIRLDVNQDGNEDKTVNLMSGRLLRR